MGCDWAWAAGFLDGEGSFMLSKVANTERRKPSISADQIEREPLDKLARTIGGSVSGPVRHTSAGNPIYRWIMRGSKELRGALPLLIPHLTVKRERAILLLEMADTFGTGGRPLSDEVLAHREDIEGRFSLTGGQ